MCIRDRFNVDGPVANSQIGNFGAGATNVAQSPITNSNVGNAGDSGVFQGNTVDHGSGLGIAGRDISGYQEDNSQHFTTEGDHSPIFAEQGPGDQHLDPAHVGHGDDPLPE